MDKEKHHSELFKVSESDYGEKYKEHLLEQYKLFVEMADKVSARRQTANNYFLTINAFLVSIFGILAESTGTGTVSQQVWRFLVPIAGILICITWAILVRSYRQLNTGKFRIIHRLEAALPAALYGAEWVELGWGEGEEYLPFTHVEIWVPLVFGALYLVLMILGVIDLVL